MRSALALAILSLASPTCAPPSGQGLTQIVDRFAAQTAFQGVVLVARGDSVVLAAPYGLADIEAGDSAHVDTRYQVGSVAKWLASILVLQQVDSGALSLTEPLGAYLPGLPDATARGVTLHHLLSNTSGVPDGVVAAYEDDPTALDAAISTEAAVRRFAGGDLRFEPGTRFDYAITNWVLVQAVLERSTGRPFADALRDLLTAPLGLDDTGAFSTETLSRFGVAPGYARVEPSPERARLPAPPYLAAAGGVYSTAPDLLRLLDALDRGAILSDASLRRLRTVHWGAEGYAYGGHVAKVDVAGRPQPALWLTGSNGPSKARVNRVDATGHTVITLTNVGVGPEATGSLVEGVLDVLARQALARQTPPSQAELRGPDRTRPSQSR